MSSARRESVVEPSAPDTSAPASHSTTGWQVFVSHSKENAPAAFAVVAALEGAGIRCWIAPRDIPPGSNWGQGIATGISECRVFLLCCSRESYASQWVLSEVAQAAKKGNAILPLRLDRAEPPAELDLLIHRLQWIDAFPPPVASHGDAIVSAVKQQLGAATDGQVGGGARMLTTIGHFHILEKLDDAGTGQIYLAEQREPVRRTVAIKVIKPGFDTADVIAKFESERQALSRMDHPNIARVVDAGTSAQGQPYFVTEYVPGRPIIDFADTHKLSIDARLELFVQVCDALAHAHSKGIIHRDIKPSNVLAMFKDDRATVKVINFGIAKALTGERLTDQTVAAKVDDPEDLPNTPPEQARGSEDLDTRSDVYGLGALLYELLAGFKPFDVEALRQMTDAEARRVICEQDPIRPSARLKQADEPARRAASARESNPAALSRKLKGELECIPLRAMHKERLRRYGSPMQMADDIQNYCKFRPLVAAASRGRIYRCRKYVRRNWLMLALAAIVIGASIGFVTRIYVAERRATEHERTAKRINEFLLSILTRADPKQGNKFTMSDAIADSIKLLKSRDVKEELPLEVQASIWDTVGSVQRALGSYDEAEANLEKALDMRRKALEPNDPDIGRTLDHLAHLLKDMNDDRRDPAIYTRAEKMYDEAIAIFRKWPKEDDLDLAATLNNRALLLLESSPDRLAEAETNCKEALKIRRAKPAPDSDILQSMGTLVDIYRKLGPPGYTRAEEQIKEAITLASGSLKDNDPNLARLKLQYGKLLLAQERLDQAETACREALMIDVATLPRGHRYTDYARKALNDVLRKKGGKDVTVEEVERMQAEAEKKSGKM